MQDKSARPTPETGSTLGGESNDKVVSDPTIPAEEGGGEGEGEGVKTKERKSEPNAHGREDIFVLPCALQDNTCMVLSECLKIIFNQTVNWKEEERLDDVSTVCRIRKYIVHDMYVRIYSGACL